MSDPKERLRDAGVDVAAIDALFEAIDRETRTLFADYDVALPEPDSVVEFIQTAMLEEIIELGTELEDRGIVEQFEMVADDFEPDGTSSGRSNIIFVAGLMNPSEDAPDALYELGGAILVRKYSHSPD